MNGLPSFNTSASSTSFYGFSEESILSSHSTLWTVKINQGSCTIDIKEGVLNCLKYQLDKHYGNATDSGGNGLIYKTNFSSDDGTSIITLTLYISTHKLLVQGATHKLWVENNLFSIGSEILCSRDLSLQKFDFSASINSVSKLSSLLENDSPSVQLLPQDTSDQYVQTAGTSFCDQGVQACPSYHEHNGSSRSQGTQTDHTLLYTDQEIQTESHQVPLLVGQVTQTVLVSSTPPTNCKSTVANKCNDFDQSDISPDGIIKYEHIQLAPKERSCNDTYTVPTRNSFAALSVEPCYEDISENPLQASECLPMKRVKSPAVSDISVKPAFNPSSHSTPSTHSGTERRSPNPTSPPKSVYKVLIIGDSIPKHLNGRRMSRRLKVLNRCLPGSNLANWIKFAPVLIEEEKPSAVIIRCGTNDINKISPSHIASLMDELCMKIQFCDPSIQISISGLTPRLSSQANGEVLFINSKLAQICSKHELYYISNNNLSPTHLSRDGIHLNRRGITGLARNFIAFLRTLHPNSFLFNVPNQRRQHTVMSQHPAHFTKYQRPTQSLNRESPEWKNWIEFVKVL
ncbi:hypothetical protein HOLleu_22525 [Holothuria leucospilota]|uniref:SGNH hydrolase-type esterase domain-containing protein n=1 Tax=Holothuria leucospilota TaxID=206669 RepID=A0A9Q1H4P5_HOLLE|nr:hypothetical protein HOLleu_22525 [Holothuria leucospilota]